MYVPDLEQFIEHAKEGNLVPVYREILADLETPVSAFLKLQAGSNGYAFLLESVAGGENIARYSYLATAPYQVFASKEREVTITRGERVEKTALPEGQDPLDVLAGLLKEYRFVPLPGWERFAGGAVGYLGYDLVRFFEELPEENPDDLGLPDCQLMFADTMVVFDHVMHRARVVTNAHVTGDPQAAYWEALMRIDAVVEHLRMQLGAATPVASREARVASAEPTPGGAAGG